MATPMKKPWRCYWLCDVKKKKITIGVTKVVVRACVALPWLTALYAVLWKTKYVLTVSIGIKRVSDNQGLLIKCTWLIKDQKMSLTAKAEHGLEQQACINKIPQSCNQRNCKQSRSYILDYTGHFKCWSSWHLTSTFRKSLKKHGLGRTAWRNLLSKTSWEHNLGLQRFKVEVSGRNT